MYRLKIARCSRREAGMSATLTGMFITFNVNDDPGVQVLVEAYGHMT